MQGDPARWRARRRGSDRTPCESVAFPQHLALLALLMISPPGLSPVLSFAGAVEQNLSLLLGGPGVPARQTACHLAIRNPLRIGPWGETQDTAAARLAILTEEGNAQYSAYRSEGMCGLRGRRRRYPIKSALAPIGERRQRGPAQCAGEQHCDDDARWRKPFVVVMSGAFRIACECRRWNSRQD